MDSIRLTTLQHEKLILSEKASFSDKSRGRDVFESPCEIRTEYQRDRDRIIHSGAFRRLKQKTQVFLNPRSEHYRTRLTHTLEVSQIARTISRALRLNEDLTEAIALGHDLGHTPFGHDGERVLDRLFNEGFKHQGQSVRVVELLEKNGKGLNLTWEVKNGILNHGSDGKADTLEGQVVQYADKIAYINHDIDDAVRANVLEQSDLPEDCVKVLGKTKSERITTLVKSVIKNSSDIIKYDDIIKEKHDKLRKFMFDNVYYSAVTNEEKGKAQFVVEFLYDYFIKKPEEMPELYVKVAENENVPRAVCDYISGMSDLYAISMFEELCVPRSWSRRR